MQTHAQRREHHVKIQRPGVDGHRETEAEMGFMQPQAKKHLELPEAGRAKEGSSQKVLKKTWLLCHSKSVLIAL